MSKQKFGMLPETLEEVRSYLQNDFPLVDERLESFRVKFLEEFASATAYERGAAEKIIDALMEAPLKLYALKLHGPVIVELHAILERVAIKNLVRELGKADHKKTLEKLVEREGLRLVKLASIFEELGVWDKKDCKFVENLDRLRNGIVHKNPLPISKLVLSGGELAYLDIDSALASFNVIPYMLTTIRLLLKILQKLVRGRRRNGTHV